MNLNETFENFVNSDTFFNCLLRRLVPLAALFAMLPASAAATEAGAFVGEISLILGRVYIEQPDGERRPVEVGSQVRVNDRIVTDTNGHVHIRFVDEALVSVRPDSRLEVIRYDFDKSLPEQSTVKFNLIEGVTRSISGAAARSARERFRLNTPIAAIGVRGTDFVVSATSDTTRALVNEGTIVMAPFSELCTAEAFGPCADNAIELTGESLEILELNSDAATPSTPTLASHERNPSLLRDQVRAAINSNAQVGVDESAEADEKTATNDVYLESVTSIKATSDVQQVAQISRTTTTSVSATAKPQTEFTPYTRVPETILKNRQLVWGHWYGSVGAGALERITLPWENASEGRNVTIGGGGASGWLLYRTEPDGVGFVDAGLGVVGFNLRAAQAYYSSNTGIVAMQVNGGSLNIDFNDNTFATKLSLSHELIGPVSFAEAGGITQEGFFNRKSAIQNLHGAVSFDGKEAGYYFDRQLEGGGIQGLTLWDSR